MPRIPATCPINAPIRYTVVSGDTMFLIAQRFGITLQALIAANPQIPDPNVIFPGDVLCVPGPTPPGTRVPSSCRPGFTGRHIVQPGETMFIIAQIYRTRLEALTVNNPQITNPNLIFPGDILCVPGLVSFPCSVVMVPQIPVPLGTMGAALVHIDNLGTESVSFVATLPPPSTFGNFNAFTAQVNIPNIGGFGTQLFPTPETPPTFAGTVSLPTVVEISPTSTVIVQPLNTTTGISGSIILQGSLSQCKCPFPGCS